MFASVRTGAINTQSEKQFALPDLELLCISMRPFYLPREFGSIILCATYIPRTARAHVFILGDFNQ